MNPTFFGPLGLTILFVGRHTHRDSPGAACDAANVGLHFGRAINRTDVGLLVCITFSVPSQAIGREERLRNDLFWDVKL